jgi:hypothetical protein
MKFVSAFVDLNLKPNSTPKGFKTLSGFIQTSFDFDSFGFFSQENKEIKKLPIAFSDSSDRKQMKFVSAFVDLNLKPNSTLSNPERV